MTRQVTARGGDDERAGQAAAGPDGRPHAPGGGGVSDGPPQRPDTGGPIGHTLSGLDPEVAAAVDRLPVGTPGLGDLDGLRRLMLGPSPEPVATQDDGVLRDELEVPGPAGAPEVVVRRYRPPAGTPPWPGLVWCHGGGFVAGDLDAADARCARLCLDLDAVVLSVAYRLAPEHPFPAPVEDTDAVLAWVDTHAGALDIDPARLVVGGSSAGATLAAGAALLARDRGRSPLAAQVLVQPALDDRCDTLSAHQVVDPRVLHRAVLRELWSHYLGSEGVRGPVPAHAAPARATDLRGLPSAVITTAEHDPLRDEGLDYALRLQRSGVSTGLLHVPGTVHGFEELVPESAVARRTHRWLVESLRAALA